MKKIKLISACVKKASNYYVIGCIRLSQSRLVSVWE